ncbi:unnamed protein product [Ranitomeya imitator]|uniref:Uncharacterized protein n=1 Tax=Ranitomeya imitator TaxID=111125 RepID=A0ABN9LVD4_9NEOB|nr:unnamed protein product [Ranitomeya imitator]
MSCFLCTNRKGYKSDATSAILFGFLLFIIPGRKPSWWWCRLKEKPMPRQQIHTNDHRKEFEGKHTWDIVVLVGGGFALARDAGVGFSCGVWAQGSP